MSAQNTNQKDEAAFLLELQDSLSAVDINFKHVEFNINALNVPSGPFTLGNTALLNHETDPVRQNSYSELVNGYKWYEKTHLYSALAHTMLSHNSLKRSYFSSSNKRRRPPTSPNPSILVDQMIASLNNGNSMSVKIYRPFATCSSAFLHVSCKISKHVQCLTDSSLSSSGELVTRHEGCHHPKRSRE